MEKKINSPLYLLISRKLCCPNISEKLLTRTLIYKPRIITEDTLYVSFQLFDSFVRTGLSLSYQTASKLVKTPDCPFNAEKILELREDKRQMQHERRRQYYARLRELKKGAKEENGKL